MSRIHHLTVQRMTAESFRPFGTLIEAKDRPTSERRFFPAPFVIDGRTTVDLIWQPFAGNRFVELERHFNVTQTFVPVEGSPAVVAVAAPTDPHDPRAVPRPEDVHAFLIDGTQGYVYKTGTWHSLDRYIVEPPGASFVILNVDPNPTQVVDYEQTVGVTFEVDYASI